MRRVTNCILKHNNSILMLKKPRRGWYAMPGGKMELGESIKESVVREFKEETGLQLINPDLKGVFTFIIQEDDAVKQEWMMFTFLCEHYEGKLVDFCNEGELEWVPISEIQQKPMAEGDRSIYELILSHNELNYGTFTYTPDYQLISGKLDPSSR
ncbi:8-oxo-dGTP diphosphatase [Aquibacillus koreensis]|uniref:8-oxo-dGTP diphosphatase n=1 Tax=Aquibacillus koreensis TaxID=279446 RepID=A0A9X4AKQ2_9BACI|nr:8-oxo-dGTP diphosphatase [Aquibacillus koreensis]MCT2537313.1 8-oxo-dGTP diphosphatase [Aquibacillus koreensis]MDC3421660.1 8-oxo-dGTP diphosphatase [Aquibacillus koreensis]